jgi:hypothetical protein
MPPCGQWKCGIMFPLTSTSVQLGQGRPAKERHDASRNSAAESPAERDVLFAIGLGALGRLGCLEALGCLEEARGERSQNARLELAHREQDGRWVLVGSLERMPRDGTVERASVNAHGARH